jgi:hypothetical protein
MDAVWQRAGLEVEHGVGIDLFDLPAAAPQAWRPPLPA